MSRLSPLLSIYLGDPDMCWAWDPCFLSPWQAHGSWAPRLQGHATATRGRGSRSRVRSRPAADAPPACSAFVSARVCFSCVGFEMISLNKI